LEGISKAGYKYVHLWQNHAGKPAFTPALTAAQRAEMKKLMTDHGLKPVTSFVGLSIDVRTPEGQAAYRKELDLFREFDVRTVIGVGPGRYTRFPTELKPKEVWERECDAFLKGLEKVLPHAEELGITITLKPHADISYRASAGLEVVRRVNHPNLKACWDGGNVSYYEGINPDPDLHALAPHVRAVCIKDHRGERANADFPVPGEGQVDFDLMFRILFAAGFGGPLAVERVDGTMDATKMDAGLIDQRIKQARDFVMPLLSKYACPE